MEEGKGGEGRGGNVQNPFLQLLFERLRAASATCCWRLLVLGGPGVLLAKKLIKKQNAIVEDVSPSQDKYTQAARPGTNLPSAS
jgi:hypothetical protein